MAKLNACSSSIHMTQRGNGLPSAFSHVGRFLSGAATELAASAGRSVLASTSTPELFTLPLFHPLPTARLAGQCGSPTTPPNCGNELSNLLAPFHRICTPMHTSKNAESFKITFVPVGPSLLASRSA